MATYEYSPTLLLDHEAVDRDARSMHLKFIHGDRNSSLWRIDFDQGHLGTLSVTHPHVKVPGGYLRCYHAEIDEIRLNDSFYNHSATLRSILSVSSMLPDIKSLNVLNLETDDDQGVIIDGSSDRDVAQILGDLTDPEYHHLDGWMVNGEDSESNYVQTLLEKREPAAIDTKTAVVAEGSGHIALSTAAETNYINPESLAA